MGPVCEAAGLLFSEFHRLGVLESQFLETDDSFLTRKKLNPDENVRRGFDAALDLAESKAHQRLAGNPNDKDALFALTLSNCRGLVKQNINRRRPTAHGSHSRYWAAFRHPAQRPDSRAGTFADVQ